MANASDQLIDLFVARLKASGVAVRQEDNSSRLTQLQAKLPKRMPQSYESFLSRYSFVPFDTGGITLFGWDSTSAVDIDMIPLAERDMSKELVSAGFVQIGQLETRSYDPICFDLNSQRNNRECRIVQADHEQILQWSRIKVLREVWPSFRKLVEHHLSLP
jgi:hypothetical protein